MAAGALARCRPPWRRIPRRSRRCPASRCRRTRTWRRTRPGRSTTRRQRRTRWTLARSWTPAWPSPRPSRPTSGTSRTSNGASRATRTLPLPGCATTSPYVPYAGVLRGPDGTIAARSGNAFDRALLLKTLLDSSARAGPFCLRPAGRHARSASAGADVPARRRPRSRMPASRRWCRWIPTPSWRARSVTTPAFALPLAIASTG